MGILVGGQGDEEIEECPVACPLCDQGFANQKGLRMHCRMSHGERCEAWKCLVGPVCPTCNANYVTKKRVFDRLMRGALACMLPWRFGDLPAVPPDMVEDTDLADLADRRVARRVVVIPGTGKPLFCSC